MKSMSVALKAAYASGTSTICTCVKATLTNGTVVATTSRQRSFTFDSVEYLSTAGYTASDIESSAELNPDNLEIEGFLASPAITDADIHTGIWDYAAIEMFEVNFADLTQGRNPLRTGTLGEVKGGRSKFIAELRGLLQAYSRKIVWVTQKDCRYDLGDARCTIDLALWTVTGSVDAVTSNRQFSDTARVEPDDMFTAGKITFLSGLNAGLSMEVKQSTAAAGSPVSGGVITLHHLMPFDIQVGDYYEMHVGCQKRFSLDCKGRFSNAVNFGGEHLLPGSRIYAGASSGAGTTTEPDTVEAGSLTGGLGAGGDYTGGGDGSAPDPGLDYTPDAITITPTVTGATANTPYFSDAITVSGLSAGVKVHCIATGAGYVDAAAETLTGTYSPVVEAFEVSAAGTFVFKVMGVASITPGATAVTTISITTFSGYGETFHSGTGVTAEFSITTAA